MQAQQAHLKFSEAEQPHGDRLLKIGLETDRVEGYSEPHSLLIARLATRLGEKMGIHGIELTGLKFAALVHDIGERAMKRNYLLHSYQLTWEETLDLWRHPILGEQAAAELGLSRLTQLLIRWHHEWWNGHGYPDSLQRHAIPLAARILRVVDSYCSLISNRPHRMRFAPSEAEQIIADLAGIEFDPIVVKMLLEMLNEKQRNRQLDIRGIDTESETYPTLSSQEPQTIPPEAVLPKPEFIELKPQPFPVPTFQESPRVVNELEPEPIELALRGPDLIAPEPEPEPIEIALTGSEFIEPDPEFYPVPTFQEPQTVAGTAEVEPSEAATASREYLEEVIILAEHLAISEVALPADPHLTAESEQIESASETRESSINFRPAPEHSPEYPDKESTEEVEIRSQEQEKNKVERPAAKSEG